MARTADPAIDHAVLALLRPDAVRSSTDLSRELTRSDFAVLGALTRLVAAGQAQRELIRGASSYRYGYRRAG